MNSYLHFSCHTLITIWLLLSVLFNDINCQNNVCSAWNEPEVSVKWQRWGKLWYFPKNMSPCAMPHPWSFITCNSQSLPLFFKILATAKCVNSRHFCTLLLGNFLTSHRRCLKPDISNNFWVQNFWNSTQSTKAEKPSYPVHRHTVKGTIKRATRPMGTTTIA